MWGFTIHGVPQGCAEAGLRMQADALVGCGPLTLFLDF